MRESAGLPRLVRGPRRRGESGAASARVVPAAAIDRPIVQLAGGALGAGGFPGVAQHCPIGRRRFAGPELPGAGTGTCCAGPSDCVDGMFSALSLRSNKGREYCNGRIFMVFVILWGYINLNYMNN